MIKPRFLIHLFKDVMILKYQCKSFIVERKQSNYFTKSPKFEYLIPFIM